ncbi:helix-turn-helix transcriptional regulator [Polaromonas sp. C04]|uniref:response regulator transcription factor n=1 Tax=Polaromonas sp. C04 TaxID=1945857 RepID=UPI000986B749|nr:helix-turn-helix transcriptional regulator [Polaromonas sp. C04]OOG51609.1 hypothetical protein B0E49_15265 [Polaromonas sp. C04]
MSQRLAPCREPTSPAAEPGASALLGTLVAGLRASRIASAAIVATDVHSPSKTVVAAYPAGLHAQLGSFDGRMDEPLERQNELPPPVQWHRRSDPQLAMLGWPKWMLKNGYNSLIRIRFPMGVAIECLLFSMADGFESEQLGVALWALMSMWDQLKTALLAERAILTPREVDCLQAAFDGLTAVQTAKKLGCTERSVRMHLSHVIAKLGAPNTIAAARRAQMLGII